MAETTRAPDFAAAGSPTSATSTGVLETVAIRASFACSDPGGAARPCSPRTSVIPDEPSLPTASRSFPHPMNAVTAHASTPQTCAKFILATNVLQSSQQLIVVPTVILADLYSHLG